MLCLRVIVDGNIRRTIGLPDADYLRVEIWALQMNGQDRPTVMSGASSRGTHAKWLDVGVKNGSVVVVQLLEHSRPDEPVEIRRPGEPDQTMVDILNMKEECDKIRQELEWKYAPAKVSQAREEDRVRLQDPIRLVAGFVGGLSKVIGIDTVGSASVEICWDASESITGEHGMEAIPSARVEGLAHSRDFDRRQVRWQLGRLNVGGSVEVELTTAIPLSPPDSIDAASSATPEDAEEFWEECRAEREKLERKQST